VVLDRYVLAFDVTSFAETFAERRDVSCVRRYRPTRSGETRPPAAPAAELAQRSARPLLSQQQF
ncbi:MAG: hypothetical protein WCB61_24920, partial [Pseudolabrys sp.]